MSGPRHGRRWTLSLCLGFLLVLGAIPGVASGATLTSGFFTQTVADGLSQPTAVAWLPDGRMLVAEKPGVVKVVATDGTVESQPLLDFSDEVNDSNDRGLLGIAVAPDFATSRKLYLLYVYDATYVADPSTGQDSPSPEVARLTRVTLDANGVPGPEEVILGSLGKAPCPPAANDLDCIPVNALSHTIGTVRAAPDGTLWMGSGDAATAGDVDDRALGAYDERGFQGKIVHVDGDGQGLPNHPFCPADSDLDHVCTKVYAKGFRNPFRFSLRPGAGPLVGDVGWRTREEIDRVVPGGNYGWPCYEGAIHTPGYSDLPACAAEFAKEGTANADVMPDYDYDHSVGLTVVAGFVYSGTGYPAADVGRTVFGDYTNGFVRWLDFDAAGVPAVTPLADDLVAVDLEPAPDNGDIVYAGYSPLGEGIVGRIIHSPQAPPVAVASADATSGSSPLTVKFDSKGSAGDDLTYHWAFGDKAADSTDAAPTHVYTAAGVYHVTLQVQDSHGLHATDHLTIAVDDQPPVATLSAPTGSDTYVDGALVGLVGSAKDPEEGTLTGARLSWEIRLHEGDDPDVLELPTRVGQRPVFITRTDHDAGSYYEIVLTATDSAGLTDTKSVTIHPQTAPFEIDSDPPGAPVAYNGVPAVAPWQTTSAVGFKTTVSAAASFTANGHQYAFDHWSDGGAAEHAIQIPAAGKTLTAHYRDVTPAPSPPPAIEAPGPSDYAPAEAGLGTPPASSDTRRARVFQFRLDRRRGRLSGRVDAIRSLDVALRAWRDRRGGCRWWSRGRGRLLARSSCARPVWIHATVRGGRWSADLRGIPPRGFYVALFRARDALGNLSRASAATRSTT